MKTVETKISKSGAKIYYVDGKRTNRENAMFIQRMNDAEARRLAKIDAEVKTDEVKADTVKTDEVKADETQGYIFTTTKAYSGCSWQAEHYSKLERIDYRCEILGDSEHFDGSLYREVVFYDADRAHAWAVKTADGKVIISGHDEPDFDKIVEAVKAYENADDEVKDDDNKLAELFEDREVKRRAALHSSLDSDESKAARDANKAVEEFIGKVAKDLRDKAPVGLSVVASWDSADLDAPKFVVIELATDKRTCYSKIAQVKAALTVTKTDTPEKKVEKLFDAYEAQNSVAHISENGYIAAVNFQPQNDVRWHCKIRRYENLDEAIDAVRYVNEHDTFTVTRGGRVETEYGKRNERTREYFARNLYGVEYFKEAYFDELADQYAVTVDAFNFAVDNEIEEAEIAAAESRAIARILADDNLAARYEKAKSQVKCERYENGYCGWYFKGKHSDKWECDQAKTAACLTRYGLSRFEFSVLSEDETAVINSSGYDESAFDLLPTVDELNDVEIADEAKTDEPEITDETDEDAHNTTGKIEVAIGADAMPAMIDLFEPNKITLNTPAQILKLIEDAAGNSFSFDYESYFINTDDDTRHKFITRHFVSECKNYSFIEIFTDDGKLDHVEFLKHFLAGYKEVKFYLAAPAQDNVDVDRELVNPGIDKKKKAAIIIRKGGDNDGSHKYCRSDEIRHAVDVYESKSGQFDKVVQRLEFPERNRNRTRQHFATVSVRNRSNVRKPKRSRASNSSDGLWLFICRRGVDCVKPSHIHRNLRR